MNIIGKESGLFDTFTKQQLDNIQIIVNNLSNQDISEFLQTFLMGVVNQKNDTDIKVSIMTIHSSKGLEFDNVFIPGMIEGVFPNVLCIQEGTISEERRLLYVGITRACERLYLTYSMNNKHGKFFGPSRFLRDINNDITFKII